MEVPGLPIDPRAATEALAKGLGTIFGKPADEMAELLAQELRYIRLARAAKLLEKTERLLEGRANLRQPALKFLLPYLESATLEEDENLQSMWAHLLADEASTPKSQNLLFIDVLRALSANDARFFTEQFPLEAGAAYTGTPYESWLVNVREHIETYAVQTLFSNATKQLEGADEDARKVFGEDLQSAHRAFVDGVRKGRSMEGVFLLWHTVSYVNRNQRGAWIGGRGQHYCYLEGYKEWMPHIRNLQYLNILNVREHVIQHPHEYRVTVTWAEVTQFGVEFAKSVGMLKPPA